MLLFPLLACACAGGQRSEPLGVEYRRLSTADSVQRASFARLHPAIVGEIVGLPSLVHRALPAGHREIRLQLGCDLCLPDYLVRIVQEPSERGTAVDGDVFVRFALTAERRSADERRQVEASLRASADTLARRVGCNGWREGFFPSRTYHWCWAGERSAEAWRSLFDRLESLKVLELAADTGYSPTPPTVQRVRTTVRDSVAEIAFPEPYCTDIGGQSLLVEVLEGASYRQAFLWCLEAPLGDEHRRASQALESLRRFVHREGI